MAPASHKKAIIIAIIIIVCCGCACSVFAYYLNNTGSTGNSGGSGDSGAASNSGAANNPASNSGAVSNSGAASNSGAVSNNVCIQTACTNMRADSNYSALAATSASMWSDNQRNTAITIVNNATSLTVAKLQTLPNADLFNLLTSTSPLTTAIGFGGILPALKQPGTTGGRAALTAPSSLVSNNKLYTMVVQTDANLVVYKTDGPVVWSSNSTGVVDAYVLVLMYAGYLALVTPADPTAPSNTKYKSGSMVYWTNGLQTNQVPAAGQGPYSLIMQDSGKLQVVSATGTVAWSSS